MKRAHLFQIGLLALVVLLLAANAPISAQPTWPVPREESIIIEGKRLEFQFYTSMNNQAGTNDYVNGYIQIGQEYLFLDNYATGELKPWLAEGYRYNDDYTELTILLRKGVHWNDGVPFTSADVVYTLETSFAGATVIESITAPDDYTVVIKRTNSNPRFINTFRGAIVGLSIFPKHIYEQVEDIATFSNFPPVSTSVWKLKEANPDLKAFIWERDENYWGKDVFGFPAARYVIFTASSGSPDDSYQRFIDGDLDYTDNLDWPLLELALAESSDVTYMTFQDPCPRTIAFNTARYPLNMPEMRQAIANLVDRQKAATELSQPVSVVADYPWAEWSTLKPFVSQTAVAEYPIEFDPEQAAKTFEALGFKMGADGVRVDKDGNRLAFEVVTPVNNNFGVAVLEELVQQAEKAGVSFTLNQESLMTKGKYEELIAAGTFDMTIDWLCSVNVDAYQLYRALAGTHYTAYQNDRFDELVAELAKYPPDAPEIQSVYAEAFRTMMADLPILPLIQANSFQGWSNKHWTNWPTDVNPYAVPFTWWATFYHIPFELKPAN